MAKLIYMMNTSLDGYTEDEHGDFGWTAPQDEEVHTWIFAHMSSFRTWLSGRRAYETMLYWETAHTVTDQPQFVLDFARQWQAAEKIVYSRTLAEPRSARTRIERSFDPDGVRKLKANVASDIAVGRVPNACLPSGHRRWKTVLPTWYAAGSGTGRGAAVPQRGDLSAICGPRPVEVKGGTSPVGHELARNRDYPHNPSRP